MFTEGLFESVALERNRLLSQLLDNLNKSALVGFNYTEIGSMLKSAWSGEPGQKNVYDDVQKCVSLFREYCLDNNLLDYSLQVEIFHHYIINMSEFNEIFYRTYKHMIVDNIEEDTPVAHKIIQNWSSEMESGLFVYDSDAGFRNFLGADPGSAYELKEICLEAFQFDQSFVSSEEIEMFNRLLIQKIKPEKNSITSKKLPPVESPSHFNPKGAFEIGLNRYFPDMLDWSVDLADGLIRNGISPREIVVISPYLSDSLSFMLSERFNNKGIPFITHRPSRALRDEPVIRCLLTLAALSFPEWGYTPAKPEVINALITAIRGIDLVRANLLTKIVYRDKKNPPELSEYKLIKPEIQERITYRFGEKYEQLREWLQENQAVDENLDVFVSRLFGEILSQPGFGLYLDIHSSQIVANFIESIRKFN